MFRGVILVVIGIIIGVVILASTVDEADDTDSATTTTAADGAASTTSTTAAAAVPQPVGPTATTQPVVISPQPHSPSEVRVQVANATDISGAAGRLTNELTVAGYIGLPAINAPAEVTPLSQSIIYYEPNYLADANQIASLLGATPNQVLPLPVPSPIVTDSAHVIVVIGDDSLAQAA